MDTKNIQDVVMSALTFSFGVAKDWNRIYCEVCGDGSRTKGPRGGWLFNEEMCFYHCFNCGVEGNFNPDREQPFSKDMRKIFESFRIDAKEYNTIVFHKRLNKDAKTGGVKKQNSVEKIEMPDHFYTLKDAAKDNVMAEKARAYLRSRNVNPDSYPFYMSTGITTNKDSGVAAKAKLLINRVIIPSFKNNMMVYYQARSLEPITKMPYVNAEVPRGNIIYGYDKLYSSAKAPLFVTEGFFDAYHLNGVAVLENKISKAQIEILEKSPRTKVVVPDKKGDSNKLAEQAIELGWGVSFPNIGSSCKDIDEAVAKYGKLYVIDSVMKNIKEGSSAKILLQLL